MYISTIIYKSTTKPKKKTTIGFGMATKFNK